MNQTIKKRIEEINNGIVPEGYEKTSFGIFPCDWIKVSLGEVSAKKGEYGLNAPACEYEEGLPKYLRITDIDDQGRYIDNKACVNDADSHKYVLNKGDIVFARTGASVGKNYIYDEKDGFLVYAGFLIKFSIKPQYNANLICSNCRTKKYNNWVAKMCARSGQPGINAEEYATYSFIIPKSAQEQSRIAEILMQWDKAIELQEKLIEAYQKSKKYYLNKMFPKKGSNIPEIRFPGFTTPWEQRKLSDEVQIIMGQSPDGSTYRETPAKYILVQGNADLKDGWVFPRVWTTQKTKTAEAGDLIMSVRAPAGAMGKTAYNVVLGRGVAAIKGNEFIFQALTKMDSDGYWKKLAAGSTFESINSDTVSNAVIYVPQENNEQCKLGEYFNSLDNLITLHHQKRDKLLKQRKAMQQYLLTGIVRV